MKDIYVLNANFELLGVIDNYTSCIWANRYNDIGDCELYLEAVDESLNILSKGNYLYRLDDEMICRINRIELNTDAENGNNMVVTGTDVKSFLKQRVIWGTISANGNVEDYIREMVNDNLCNPNLSARQLRKADGTRLMYLGDKANFTEVTTEQTSYSNVWEKVNELCTKYGWGQKIILGNNLLYFVLYNGVDRSNEVLFSKNFENLATTKYIEDETNLGNVALVTGEGEGAARVRNVSGYAEGMDRYEIYVDARDLSKTITWEDLIDLYPTTEQGGQGYITTESNYYVYRMNYINLQIVDANQLEELQESYPDGSLITIDGNQYYQIYNATIADLPSNTMEESDTVVLRDIVYSIYLLNRGYENLAQYGATVSFEGTVEPNITFEYKKDYFLGDRVMVENEFGIRVAARIIEVIEITDENGYSVEPKFEYLEV